MEQIKKTELILKIISKIPKFDAMNPDNEPGVTISDIWKDRVIKSYLTSGTTETKDPSIRKKLQRLVEQICREYNLEILVSEDDWQYAEIAETKKRFEQRYRFGRQSRLPHIPMDEKESAEVFALYKYLVQTGAVESTNFFNNLAKSAEAVLADESKVGIDKTKKSLPTIIIQPPGHRRETKSANLASEQLFSNTRQKMFQCIKSNYQAKIETFEDKIHEIAPIAVGIKGYFQYLIYATTDVAIGVHKLKLLTIDLSKIKSVEIQRGNFPSIEAFKKRISEDDLNSTLEFIKSPELPAQIELHVYGPLIGHFRSRPPLGAGISEELLRDNRDKEYLEVRMQPKLSLELKNFLLGHLQFIKVVGPEELKSQLMDDLRKAATLNEDLFERSD